MPLPSFPMRWSTALLAALAVFSGTLGWGQADRDRLAAARPALAAQSGAGTGPGTGPGSGSGSGAAAAKPSTKPAPSSPKPEEAFVWPVLAPISSPFGPREGRRHNGIDLAANMGDSIRAARSGSVRLAGEVTGYGQTVILDHPDGTSTLYGHCSKLLVKAGQQVRQGEVIALVGSTGRSTGPHLHFEILIRDQAQDPLVYLPPRSGSR